MQQKHWLNLKWPLPLKKKFFSEETYLDHRWSSRYFFKVYKKAGHITGEKTEFLHIPGINLFFYNYHKKHYITWQPRSQKVLQHSVCLKPPLLIRLLIQELALFSLEINIIKYGYFILINYRPAKSVTSSSSQHANRSSKKETWFRYFPKRVSLLFLTDFHNLMTRCLLCCSTIPFLLPSAICKNTLERFQRAET